MSHFIGLVFVDQYNNYEEMLEPFNEQNEDYYQFEDCTDEVTERWNTLPDLDAEPTSHPCDKAHYPTIQDLAKHWYGYRIVKDDDGNERYGYNHNPNAKWDWYSEGGRWNGYLPTKEGTRTDADLVSEIDWDKFIAEHNAPFCFVDTECEWHEKAEMGWWAQTWNEKEPADWDKEFKDYVQSLLNEDDRDENGVPYADGCMVYAIDFHI